MKAPESIYTARLCLRRPSAADASAIFAAYASNIEVTRYLSWSRHVSLADTRQFIDFSTSEWQRTPAGPYLIELRSDGELIGSTGLEFESAACAFTGYVLAQHSWGLGYATEALSVITALAPQLGLRQLYALCHPENLASCRVLNKCGFISAGMLLGHTVFPNLNREQCCDVWRYSKKFD